MDRERLRAIVGIAMVALGLVQAGFGAAQGELLFSALGLTYGLLGVLYLWAEVYAAGGTGENNT